MQRTLSSLTLSWRAWNRKTVVLIAVAAFWNGCLVPFLKAFISMHSYGLLACMSLHLLVGLSLAFAVLVRVLNRSTLTVTDSSLTLHNRPIAVGEFECGVAEIRQLYCEAEQQEDSDSSRFSYTFSLMIALKDGSRRKVLQVDAVNDALWLECEIERFLKIEDAPVTKRAYAVQDLPESSR